MYCAMNLINLMAAPLSTSVMNPWQRQMRSMHANRGAVGMKHYGQSLLERVSFQLRGWCGHCMVQLFMHNEHSCAMPWTPSSKLESSGLGKLMGLKHYGGTCAMTSTSVSCMQTGSGPLSSYTMSTVSLKIPLEHNLNGGFLKPWISLGLPYER